MSQMSAVAKLRSYSIATALEYINFLSLFLSYPISRSLPGVNLSKRGCSKTGRVVACVVGMGDRKGGAGEEG